MAQLQSTTVDGSADISGSFQLTGSINLQVISASFASNTCSIDMSLGSFFVTTLASTGATKNHFDITNAQKGTTANILVNSIPNATASFSPNVLQPSGSEYLPGPDSGDKDVLTLVSFDENSVYVANVTQLI